MERSVPILSGGSNLDYELIDTGDFEKLERFGSYVLRRPEPQAMWPKSLSDADWKSMTHAEYRRLKSSHYRDAEEAGQWTLKPGVREPWEVQYTLASGKTLRFKLGFTAFKHVGIFPEQSVNWRWMEAFLQGNAPRVLNLFAYTGGASLVARAAGAEVVHLDSVKGMITWARENADLNGLEGIRWVVEDAAKFVEREVRRQHRYDLIILDPPAYGRGPNGEKWVLEPMLWPMLEQCKQLLQPGGRVLCNLYSLNHSALLLHNAGAGKDHWGESVLTDRGGRMLPLGIIGTISPA